MATVAAGDNISTTTFVIKVYAVIWCAVYHIKCHDDTADRDIIDHCLYQDLIPIASWGRLISSLTLGGKTKPTTGWWRKPGESWTTERG